MRVIVIIAMILGSLGALAESLVASDCRVLFLTGGRRFQCQFCDDVPNNEFYQKASNELTRLGFVTTQDKNDAYDFVLETKTNIGEVREFLPTRVQVLATLTNLKTKQVWVSEGKALDTFNSIKAENRALKKAVSGLPSCEKE